MNEMNARLIRAFNVNPKEVYFFHNIANLTTDFEYSNSLQYNNGKEVTMESRPWCQNVYAKALCVTAISNQTV